MRDPLDLLRLIVEVVRFMIDAATSEPHLVLFGLLVVFALRNLPLLLRAIWAFITLPFRVPQMIRSTDPEDRVALFGLALGVAGLGGAIALGIWEGLSRQTPP